MGPYDEGVPSFQRREVTDRLDAHLPQPFDLLGVVYERAETIDAPFACRLVRSTDRPLYAEAEACFVGQKNFHLGYFTFLISDSIRSRTSLMFKFVESIRRASSAFRSGARERMLSC